MSGLTINPDIKEQVEELRELLVSLKELEESVSLIKFLTVADVAELTGWNRKTVSELFNRPDFPCCDFGRKKVVELTAMRKYFSVPRRKGYTYA